MEQSAEPAKGETWELKSKDSENELTNLYYFVWICSTNETLAVGGREVNYYPIHSKSGSVYRCVVTRKSKDFLSFYKKKTGVTWWPNRALTVPEFVTVPPKLLESIEYCSQVNLERVAGALEEHFEAKRAEYNALRWRVDELKTDLMLYDEFKRIL